MRQTEQTGYEVAMMPIPAKDDRLPPYYGLLFRVAYARPRPYCFGCIFLTPDERAYQRRVFKLARAWRKQLRHHSAPPTQEVGAARV